MGLLHMVLVNVEGCDPCRTGEIVRACRSHWKRNRPRHEMSRIEAGASLAPSAFLSVFAMIDLPGEAALGNARDFVERLAYAVWKANCGYCFVEVVVNNTKLMDGVHTCFCEESYEALQAHAGQDADKCRRLAGIAPREERTLFDETAQPSP